MLPFPSNFNWITLPKFTGEKAVNGISILLQPPIDGAPEEGTVKVYAFSTGPGLIRYIFKLVELEV